MLALRFLASGPAPRELAIGNVNGQNNMEEMMINHATLRTTIRYESAWFFADRYISIYIYIHMCIYIYIIHKLKMEYFKVQLVVNDVNCTIDEFGFRYSGMYFIV